MIPITLGTDKKTEKAINLEPDLFTTHFHMIGATGTGKTTAIHTLLHPLMMNSMQKACLFIVDPMGNFSRDLLRWMVSERLCPEHVRKRLLYIEPAREEFVLPFNPLLYGSEANQYYQIARAVDIILRGWASQNIQEMPRLRRWTFNSFTAASTKGYPIAICRYLLHPGSDEHDALLRQLPDELQVEWAEILHARGSEATRILDSTRNRLGPFFDSVILRRMFGSVRSHFDVERFIRERRIVVINLAEYGTLPAHLGYTIGGLIVNEIIEKVKSLTKQIVDPTYVVLDEFQNFVGGDLYHALPIVRQLGLRLILAHQSFSQLEQGDIDLSGIIWQARSRLMFANDADDADRLAHEVAMHTFDPEEIKQVLWTRRQRIAGHRKESLKSSSITSTASAADMKQRGTRHGRQTGETLAPEARVPTRHTGSGSDLSDSEARTDATSQGRTVGEHESLVPIHEDFMEVSKIMYKTFDEERTEWGKRIRKLRTGETLGKFVNDPQLYEIDVEQHPIPQSAATEAAVQELMDQNFQSDLFLSSSTVDRELEQLRLSLLKEPTIVIQSTDDAPGTPLRLESDHQEGDPTAGSKRSPNPFRNPKRT